MIFRELIHKGTRVLVTGGPLSGLYGDVVLIGESRQEFAVKFGDGQILIVDAVFLHAVQ